LGKSPQTESVLLANADEIAPPVNIVAKVALMIWRRFLKTKGSVISLAGISFFVFISILVTRQLIYARKPGQTILYYFPFGIHAHSFLTFSSVINASENSCT